MPAEQLKTLDQVALPDDRAAFFSTTDLVTGIPRPLALGDLHARAAAIQLPEGVPELIRSHFATATNLLVYAWFYYPFTVTGHFLSMISIEYALRIRFDAKPANGFKDLVRRAVKEGLVRDEGFSHIASEAPALNSSQQWLPTVSATIDELTGEPKRYVDELIGVLPTLRNLYAHGQHTVRPYSSLSVQIAADFINQLYPIREDRNHDAQELISSDPSAGNQDQGG